MTLFGASDATAFSPILLLVELRSLFICISNYYDFIKNFIFQMNHEKIFFIDPYLYI